jgi:hypothetical protein
MKEVFKHPFYILLTVLVFFAVIVFTIWLPNLPFISHTMATDQLTAVQKIGLLKASLGAFKTNFTALSRLLDVIIAFLFSVDVSLLIYYLKRRISLEKSVGTSALGIFLGVIGVGCASCGSVILTSLLGLSAASSFISILPLKGMEFGLISVTLLTYSIYVLLKQIKNPSVCKVAEKEEED